MKDSPLWQLLAVFAPLSLLSIGGGQSIVADIQLQAVSVHHWLSQDQFLDDFAIARASPGPNSMIVTLIGWQVAGVAGAAVASLAIYLPSSVLFYGLTILWRRHTFGRWRDRLARGLAPVSVGLVLASSYSIMVANGGGLLSWLVTAASLLALLLTRVHPILLLAGGATVFLLRTHLITA
jgi:chromate transporter